MEKREGLPKKGTPTGSISDLKAKTSNRFSVSSTNDQIDGYITRLWRLREKANQSYMLTAEEMTALCQSARALLLSQPGLLDLGGPLKVVGDIHGQYEDLLRIFDLCGNPETTNYLFLGDYVDRGKQSLETICLLFCYKLRYPTRFFLLRGNHESQAISRIYGFFEECKRRFNVKLWKTFIDAFACLPVCAVIENQIFCCHGGLSPEMFNSELTNLADLKRRIREIVRPCDVPDCGLLCDILWSDPWYVEVITGDKEPQGWEPNERGVSYMFGPDIIDQFLERYDLDLICRAHQVVEDGYEFYANRSLVTIFSAPNYCGEFDNAAAVFSLNRPTVSSMKTAKNSDELELEGSFHIIKSEFPASGKPVRPEGFQRNS
ncbi:hypothetical protein Aperf_G00000001212 [Anoplocephala perfoliata]